jgi:hypothetical protein
VLAQAGIRSVDVSLRARQAKQIEVSRAFRLQTRADRTELDRILTNRIRCWVLGRNDEDWLAKLA